MFSKEIEDQLLRMSRQIVLKAMDQIRSTMRGSNRLALKEAVTNENVEKDILNQTKGIDKEAEDLIINGIQKKFKKIPQIKIYTIFSEEQGIKTFPQGANEEDADIAIFIDPIDGTEFIETLQGGWCLLGIYDCKANETLVTVAGDIFLNRLYWASKNTVAECLDFTTHSWFKLDGGPDPKTTVAGARINCLTTKVDRYLAIAKQEKLLVELKKDDGRINLSWGSNMLIQVAAGYADAAIETTKGFATYDILPGLFLGLKAGLLIVDEKGDPVSARLDLKEIYEAYRKDPKKPKRLKFIAAKNKQLVQQIMGLLV